MTHNVIKSVAQPLRPASRNIEAGYESQIAAGAWGTLCITLRF